MSANRLNALLADHRAAVEELVARAESIPHDRWDTPRGPGKWTPGQEVTHVDQAYHAFLRELRGEIGMRTVGTPVKRLLWRAIGLTSILWLKKIPKGARAPRETRPGDGSVDPNTALQGLRERTTRFETVFREVWSMTPAKRLTHPYFGALSLQQSLVMITVHTRHHARLLPTL